MRTSSGDIGMLPAIAAGTLLVFSAVWAAMHDIAHADGGAWIEHALLAAGLPAFSFLYRAALIHLTPRERALWLAGTGLLLLTANLGALSAAVRPRYAADPVLGMGFLAIGVPAFGMVCLHLRRTGRDGEARRPKAQENSRAS